LLLIPFLFDFAANMLGIIPAHTTLNFGR